MPQAIDIVIYNGASTPVEKTFTLIAPAAGDGSYANWRLKEGTIASVFWLCARCRVRSAAP